MTARDTTAYTYRQLIDTIDSDGNIMRSYDWPVSTPNQLNLDWIQNDNPRKVIWLHHKLVLRTPDGRDIPA